LKDILIVDDNPDLLPVMVGLLELAGHHVVSAESCEEGLKLAREYQPRIAVLDYHLAKQGEGLGMLDAIRSSPGLSQTRVIMMSGLDRSKECFEKGADGFLQKPFDLEDLLAEIQRLGANWED